MAKRDDQAAFIARVAKPEEVEATHALATMDAAFDKINGWLGVLGIERIIVTRLTAHGRRALARKIREYLKPRALNDFVRALNGDNGDAATTDIPDLDRVEFHASALSTMTEEQRSAVEVRLRELDAAKTTADAATSAVEAVRDV